MTSRLRDCLTKLSLRTNHQIIDDINVTMSLNSIICANLNYKVVTVHMAQSVDVTY